MKKTLVGLVTLSLVMSLLSGCSKKSEDDIYNSSEKKPVNIEFLCGSQTMADWFAGYFPEYISGENPEKIKVAVEFQADATQILQMKAATNEIPDMINVGLPQEMISRGQFLDLSDGPWWNSTIPAAKDIATDVQSGKVYHVPMGSGAVGIFYNTKIIEDIGVEIPTTWDEYIQVLEKVKAEMPDVTPMYIGGKDSWSLGHIIEFTLMGVAKQELGYVNYEKALSTNDLVSLAWNDNEDGTLAKFAECMIQLKEKGLINDNVVTVTTDNLADAFVNGRVAFASQGMWALGAMQEKNPDFKNIGFMAYPSIMPNTSQTVGGPLEGTIAISSSSEPEKIEAAKIVLARMTSADAIKNFCETNGTIPIRTDVDANWSFLKDSVKDVMNTANVQMFTQNLPGAFNSDENGRLVQNIFVDKYENPTEFAKDYLNMWNKAYVAAN